MPGTSVAIAVVMDALDHAITARGANPGRSPKRGAPDHHWLERVHHVETEGCTA
jgi:hypothetical protein